VGASPPSQLALCKKREGILVNDKTMEFSKDRLNKQIRDLVRENSLLKNSLFIKDKEVTALQDKLTEADSTINVLSIMFGVVLLMFIAVLLFTVQWWR
jgi:predicted nuclease with TOPRIM domain